MFYCESDVIVLPACGGILLHTMTADSHFCTSVFVKRVILLHCYDDACTGTFGQESGTLYGGGTVLDASVLQPHTVCVRQIHMLVSISEMLSRIKCSEKPHFSEMTDYNEFLNTYEMIFFWF